jgi:hypothetical protein
MVLCRAMRQGALGAWDAGRNKSEVRARGDGAAVMGERAQDVLGGPMPGANSTPLAVDAPFAVAFWSSWVREEQVV